MVGGGKPVGAILERGGEGEGGIVRNFLLLEGRAPAGSGRPATGRDRRDQAGIGRPCVRLLHDPRRRRSECARTDRRRLLARRFGRHQCSGWSRLSKTCCPDGAAAGAMEVRQKFLISQRAGYSVACAFEELFGRMTSHATPISVCTRSSR